MRKSTPDYESALKVLVQLKGLSSFDAPRVSTDSCCITAKDAGRAEEAIKYIIFLSDANKLFDLALGMYDFALVLMIAQHSQKVSIPSPRSASALTEQFSNLGSKRIFTIPSRIEKITRFRTKVCY